MTERRYTDDEVASIFRAATEGSTSRAVPSSSASGLTLRDLQAIAREVDIPPDAVANAALALDHSRVPVVSQTLFGLPVGVQRVAALPRRLTDDEWELLVVDLRQTFNARGTVRSHGTLREWSNGNLHAMLEPTASGHQLRMTTYKGNARASFAAGAVTLATAAAMGLAALANGGLAAAAPATAIVATVGVVLLATRALSLPAWAKTRRQQMDAVLERATAERDSLT